MIGSMRSFAGSPHRQVCIQARQVSALRGIAGRTAGLGSSAWARPDAAGPTLGQVAALARRSACTLSIAERSGAGDQSPFLELSGC
jgi:hypothetical protein